MGWAWQAKVIVPESFAICRNLCDCKLTENWLTHDAEGYHPGLLTQKTLRFFSPKVSPPPPYTHTKYRQQCSFCSKLTQLSTALSHCIIWVVIKPQLQGCMGTRQFSLMKYRLAVVEVKQVDIHLEVAMRIYHKATKEVGRGKTPNNEPEF